MFIVEVNGKERSTHIEYPPAWKWFCRHGGYGDRVKIIEKEYDTEYVVADTDWPDERNADPSEYL